MVLPGLDETRQPKVADSAPPAGVDYEMWLGPAPKRPFNASRFHFHFRWFWDYAGGLMTDWGVHLLDYGLLGMKAASAKNRCRTGWPFCLSRPVAGNTGHTYHSI